ncbi:MAG TPA: hypothetical protein VGP72_27435 [Planctomycetota bacterium]|jgi:hypothetical protein
MSTKQTVIFTFMLVFLATALGSAGAWFHLGTELDSREKTIEQLKLQKQLLKNVIEGTPTQKGLKDIVEHPTEGLKAKLTEATNRATAVIGTDDSGMLKNRQVLYDQKEPEMTKNLEDAKTKWKALYDEWAKLNGDIEGAAKKLQAQGAEKEQKITEAQGELERELVTETTEKKRITEERRKVTDELAQIRATHEQTQDKISEVARETRKIDKIVPQGKVLAAADDLKLLTIDKGRDDGIKKGMLFTVYSSRHAGLVKMALIEITAVHSSSSDAVIVPAKRINLQDPVTGWVPSDAAMRYSVYSAGGQDENSAVELVKPKTRQDRIEAYRLLKMEREGGREKVDEYLANQTAPTAPPVEVGKGFTPIMSGDWIHNPDFVPIVSEAEYQKQVTGELLKMQDVNLSTLVFYVSESVRPYRREFLKRLCERNRCRVNDVMSPDVNYVVVPPAMSDIAALQADLEPTKAKEDVSAEIKSKRKTLESLLEAKKIGSLAIAEDKMEDLFLQRQRKTELLRGKAIQPGRSTFYVAGDTKDRSVDQTRKFIAERGGVPMSELDAGVDYVVVGSGLSPEFYEKVKKLGVKIIREDELNRFFGLE